MASSGLFLGTGSTALSGAGFFAGIFSSMAGFAATAAEGFEVRFLIVFSRESTSDPSKRPMPIRH
ncbi:hypothetical protein B1810_16075 [Panacagrimonas perspica]|nr:hypothetical protein B1810_16075 [Panacagrimonas perspica]